MTFRDLCATICIGAWNICGVSSIQKLMKYPEASSRRSLRAATIALFLGAAIATAQSGVPNFQKVNDQVYRGGQPTKQGFDYLSSLGVKTVVDLREIGEHSQAQEASWVQSDRMQYISVPLRGFSAPPDAQIAKVLALLNDPGASPVFVHCRRGADRTGTVLACYRISHDHWDNRKALDEARSLGMRFFEFAMQNYITRFKPPSASGTDATVAAQEEIAPIH